MKNVLQSVTIWGVIIGMIAQALGLSGTLEADAGLATDTAQVIVAIITAIGGGVTIYGRWTAKVPLKLPVVGVRTMSLFASLAMASVLAVSLTACQTTESFIGEEKSESYQTIAFKSAIAAVDTYKAMLDVANAYGDYPYCDPLQPEVILCKKPKQWAAVKRITHELTAKVMAMIPLIDARKNDAQFLLSIVSLVNQAQLEIAQTKEE